MELPSTRKAVKLPDRNEDSIARIIAMVTGVPRAQVNADYVHMLREADRESAEWSDDVPVTRERR